MIPGEDACCILLYGDIGEYSDVTAAAIVRELMEAEASGKRIDVRINSNGGDVYTGIAIFNALRGSKADIHIYVDGIAASMASVIALCGKPVEMSKYAAQRFGRLLRQQDGTQALLGGGGGVGKHPLRDVRPETGHQRGGNPGALL